LTPETAEETKAPEAPKPLIDTATGFELEKVDAPEDAELAYKVKDGNTVLGKIVRVRDARWESFNKGGKQLGKSATRKGAIEQVQNPPAEEPAS
jgi:hypothetical protein